MEHDMKHEKRPFRPNTTPTPNEIFDVLMARMSGDKLKVLLTIVRKTYGWHKDTDRIANVQFELLTGLPKRNIQKFKAELLAEGIIGKIPGPKGGVDEYYFLGLGDAADCTPPVQPTAPPHAADCTPPMQSTAPTKETIKRNYTKDSDEATNAASPLYKKLVESFSAGYQKLEGTKLSWVGKAAAYGKAVKTIIEQARSINRNWSDDEVWNEIRSRAAAMLKEIETERTKKRRGQKYDYYIAKLKFTPLTLMNRWNEYPARPVANTPTLPDVEIPEDELRKHEEIVNGNG
jgi:phage replication O-like protein O